MDTILKIKNLKTYYLNREGNVKAVDGVDLDVGFDESFGITPISRRSFAVFTFFR